MGNLLHSHKISSKLILPKQKHRFPRKFHKNVKYKNKEILFYLKSNLNWLNLGFGLRAAQVSLLD